MVHKLKKSLSHVYAEENTKDTRKEMFFKVEALYMALMCFVTHCLSSIVLEVGGRSPLGNTMTKSATFNALFRRNYNLKIVILATDVITGLITTVMMTMADKYGIPYLYLPWLVNTIKGMAMCEGPTLFSLAIVLLPDVTFLTGMFIFTTFLLYVEELCIWNSTFTNFRQCWRDYYSRKQYATMKIKKSLFNAHNKKLLSQSSSEDKLHIALNKLKTRQKPVEFFHKSNSQSSMDSNIRPIKSTIEGNGYFLQNQMLDITG